MGVLSSCGGGSAPGADPSNADSGRAKILRVGGTTYNVAGDATDSVFSEAGKLVRSDENVGALGHNLFGEQVNLYDGTTSFVHTDVSLPGNSPLPVSVGRRMTTGKSQALTSHFGDWDLEIPHLHGVFSSSKGWTVETGVQSTTANRCTQFGPPPQVLGQNNDGAFNPVEYWHGSFLYVPGAGSQEILQANTAANAVNFTGTQTGTPVRLTTKDRWTIVCGTPLKNGTGEGFTAISPDGTRYQFDWMVSRGYSLITKPYGTPPEYSRADDKRNRAAPADPNVFAGGYLLKRQEIWIMPTLVTDRYGNQVVYSYDTAKPWRLTKIESAESSGTPRAINIGYQDDPLNPMLISSVSDGTRTWQYGYTDLGGAGTVYGKTLTSVTLPAGGGSWAIDMAAVGAPGPMTQGGGSCDSVPEATLPQSVGKMTHPAGAQGTFKLAPVLHGRSYVDRYCMGSESDGTGWSYYPVYFLSYALKSKTISGPGLPAANPDAASPGGMTWTYTFGPANGSFAPSGGLDTKTLTVTNPDGNQTLHTFGNRFRVSEGQLQRVDEVSSGASAMRSTAHEYGAPTAGPYPDPIGYSVQMRTAGDLSTRHTPQKLRVITQRATNQEPNTFTWRVDAFDNLARPTQVTRFSSLGYTRTETTAYVDNTVRWVMGQVGSVTEASTGKVMESHTYDPATLNRASSASFGLLVQTFTYWGDGTLKTSANAAGHTTTFSNYRRGLAQDVTYADGNTEHADVNNLGGIVLLRNAVNTITTYGYDALGRLARITPPGDSGVNYFATGLTFQRLTADEGAIPAGYWKQTVTTGNAKTERYFDTLWRPVLSRTRDSALANTGSATLKRYDILGRAVFDSYPVRDISALNQSLYGTERFFDALGRTTAVSQDSELTQVGPPGSKLTTSTTYLGGPNGFGRTVTNPGGKSTTAYFRVLDSPSEDALTTLVMPEGVTVGINRDVFGKPKSITRAGGGKSLMRQYFFDINERLCKTLEPETGATVQAYHPAGNVAWRASGLDLTTGACDQASVAENKKVRFTYDYRGRLATTRYGDNSPGSTRRYHPDGLLAQAYTPTSSWTYQYNNRRLLTRETLNIGSEAYSFTRTPNDYGQVASQGYADDAVLQYSLNALGQPLALQGYADQIDWHPNGALHVYRLPNAGNRVHTVELNIRGLPQTWVDSGVLSDTYTYDRNGNVSSITDQMGGTNSRVMTYDGLDRLKTASGVWGSGSYTYDALDNLTASTVGGRTAVATIPTNTNRLDALTINGVQTPFIYDPNGNVTSRGSQTFDFDIGNRLRSATGVASYTYDAHGRRVKVVANDGTTKLQFYSLSGQLLMGKQTSSAGAVTTERYIYLAGKLIATTHSQTGTRWEHTDALGSPVAHVDAGGAITRTQFEPYGATAAGVNPNPMGFTGHVNDEGTGLVYMQQRYYEPIAGRFLSVDQVVTDANTGSSFGRYHYANNNPYRFIDPTGMSSEEAPPEEKKPPPPPPCNDACMRLRAISDAHSLGQSTTDAANASRSRSKTSSSENENSSQSKSEDSSMTKVKDSGKQNGGPDACGTAFSVCEGHAGRIYDDGYIEAGRNLAAQCIGAYKACYGAVEATTGIVSYTIVFPTGDKVTTVPWNILPPIYTPNPNAAAQYRKKYPPKGKKS